MIEFYQAYADYKDLMALTENMLEKLAIDILGTTDVPYQGEVFSFKGPFKKISMFDAILENNPQFTPENVGDREFLAKFVREELKEEVKPGFGLGKLQTIVFEETVETKLRQPTFITEYPAETSPLARRNDDNPHITDRFEFFIGGRELANGFSELNDPIDQAERFQAQVAEKMLVMMKQCITMQSLLKHLNMVYLQQRVKVLVLTVWLCFCRCTKYS